MNTSIHLEEFPIFENLSSDAQSLVSQMDFVRKVCSAGLSIRKRFNLRARLPLKSLTVISADGSFLHKFADIIKDEVNVKNFDVIEQSDDIEAKIVLDAKACGKRLGGKFQGVLNAVKAGSWEKCEGGIIANGEKVLEHEFSLSLKPKGEGENFESFEGIVVVLDTLITKELEIEGIARDVVRFIQDARKSKNLDIQDKISISFHTGDELYAQAFDIYSKFIANQTLAESVNHSANNDGMENHDKFSFSITKLN